MKQYLFIYHGGIPPASEEEGQRVMAAWQAWMEKHGSDFVDQGNAVSKSYTVSSGTRKEGATDPAMGYSVVRAVDLDAASVIAQSCPHIEMGGNVEVAEIIEM